MPVTTVVALLGTLAAGGTLAWQWINVRDHGATVTMAGMVRVDTVRDASSGSSWCRRSSSRCLSLGYIGPRGWRRGVLRHAAALVGRHGGDDHGEQPHRGVRRARGAVDPALRAGGVRPPPARFAGGGHRVFVLGSFASAVFLYGVALVYGAAGSASLTGIAPVPPSEHAVRERPLLAGFALLVVGLAFRSPLRPSTCGRPTCTGRAQPDRRDLGSATKVAGFAAFLRISWWRSLYRTDWRPIIMALATVTLVVGPSQPSCRPTSNTPPRTRRSPTPGTCHPLRRRRGL